MLCSIFSHPNRDNNTELCTRTFPILPVSKITVLFQNSVSEFQLSTSAPISFQYSRAAISNLLQLA